MGTEEKKSRRYPKETEKMGTGEKKRCQYPKEIQVPPQKALRVDIFPKERYNSWKKAPMEGKYHSRRATGGSYGFI